MTLMRLSEVAQPLSAIHQGADVGFDFVSTDTRHIQPGQLFVALRGPQFDAHDFLAQAEAQGAVAALVEHPVESGLPLLIVKDSLQALGQLAALRRQQCAARVIAITGSCGKTTTKSMIASILTAKDHTLATQGTLNNHIGVPLTLLGLQAHHRYAVVEMGANHPQEIAYLTQLARPNVAVLLNAADVHLEGFGDRKGVATAKGEIFQGLSAGGTAILNADDEYFSYWRTLVGNHPVYSFALQQAADVTASDVHLNEYGQAVFTLHTPIGATTIQLQVLGLHHVYNAVAAAAACLACDVSLAEIKEGLENTLASDKRLQLKDGKAGIKLIDDTYNGTPAGFHAAIDVLATIPGETVVVAGTMGELGDQAQQLHHQLGLYAKQQGIQHFYACGEWMQHAVAAFGPTAQYFPDKATLLTALEKTLKPGMTILVKGSKFMKMWDIVNALRELR